MHMLNTHSIINILPFQLNLHPKVGIDWIFRYIGKFLWMNQGSESGSQVPASFDLTTHHFNGDEVALIIHFTLLHGCTIFVIRDDLIVMYIQWWNWASKTTASRRTLLEQSWIWWRLRRWRQAICTAWNRFQFHQVQWRRRPCWLYVSPVWSAPSNTSSCRRWSPSAVLSPSGAFQLDWFPISARGAYVAHYLLINTWQK